MSLKPLLIVLSCLASYLQCLSQDVYDQAAELNGIPSNFLNKVDTRISKLKTALHKSNTKYLSRLKQQEKKLKNKFFARDSNLAKEIFDDADKQYEELASRLDSSQSPHEYYPYLDTLETSLQYFKKTNALVNKSQDIQNTISKIKAIEKKMESATAIKEFITKRKEFFSRQFDKSALPREIKRLNKDIYYYSQYIQECKSLLQHPAGIERKAIELLSNSTFFQDFMRRNSFLSSIFRLPPLAVNAPSTSAMPGLQTSAQVRQLLQQQLQVSNPSSLQNFQQSIRQAQKNLEELAASKISAGQQNEANPGFKPNNQKNKSFLERLELGTNFQTQQSTNYFPKTADIGLSVGYKLNDKSILGVGMSYALGLGNSWRNINLSNQGMGLRSFIDWKLKGSFWISGGYEMNYKTEFNNLNQLKDFNAWQQSGLLGMSKVVSLQSKMLKKTKVSLLWDFLSYQQRPQTPAIKFRIGYNFK